MVMTNKKRLLAIIVIITYALSFVFTYSIDSSIDKVDWWIFAVFAPVVILFFPAFILAIIIRNFTDFKHTYKIFLFTYSAGLAIVLYLNVLVLYNMLYPDYVSLHKGLNELYKTHYGDSRDSLITLAIDQLDNKQEIRGYGINNMDVVERDTVLHGDSMKYYNIGILYYIGEKITTDNAYACRYIVYADKSIEELYNKPVKANSQTRRDLDEFNHTIELSQSSIDSIMKTKNLNSR